MPVIGVFLLFDHPEDADAFKQRYNDLNIEPYYVCEA